MDRREALSNGILSLIGLGTGSQLTESVQDESACFVLHLSDDYTDPTDQQRHRMQESWKEQWKGAKHTPRLIIVSPGCKLHAESNTWLGETLGDYSYQIITKSAEEAARLYKLIKKQ